MADRTLSGVKIYLDTRTTAQWAQVSGIIPKGYLCAELTTDSKCKVKIGDGVLTYAALPYIEGSIDISDVDSEISTALGNYYTKAQTDAALGNCIKTDDTLILSCGIS